MKNNKILLGLVILVFIFICGYLIYLKVTSPEMTTVIASGVKFRLLDGDTRQPVKNTKLLICDDSVKIDWVGDIPYKRFCDDGYRKIYGSVITDSNGQFIYEITSLKIYSSDIIFDDGSRYGFAGVERSDGLGHTPSPTHLRVVNSDKNGHVISNKIYDLVNMEVKEIFTGDKSEVVYPFDVVELKTLAER